MSNKLHYIKISQTLFSLINDDRCNFLLVPVLSRYKLSNVLWLLEYDDIENIPTGSIIVCTIRNEIYLNNYRFLKKGWRIISFDIDERIIERTDVTNLIMNEERIICCKNVVNEK